MGDLAAAAAAGERPRRRLLAMIGWPRSRRPCAFPGANFMVRSRYPQAVAATNITGQAIDSTNNIVYAQIPDPTQPTGPP